MISAAFTKFRRNTASYLDKVENGETVVITRHGRPIAEVVPSSFFPEGKSWKRPALRLKLKGLSISREILMDRKKSRT